MQIHDYFRINKSFSVPEQIALAEIEKQLLSLLFIGDRVCYVTEILDVMHRALAVDQNKFIAGIFLKFQSSKDRTIPHKEKVFADFKAIGQKRIGSLEEQVHLVNIYRSIIADLFDPYITLLVSCFEFIENSFLNFQTSDLSSSERGKHEFVIKRLKGSKIFDGYDPIVRNAISHAGSNGVKYEQGFILFKNIKRGKPPVVTWVKWSTDELMEKILEVTSFIHGIDCAVNIFGVDIAEVIFQNTELERSFLWDALSKEQRQLISKQENILFAKISNDRELVQDEKIKKLSDFFFYLCGVRNMPVTSLGFASDRNAIRFEVAEKKIDVTDQNELMSRFFELFRYGIIAEPIFRLLADQFVITEVGSQSNDLLTVICEASDLKKYGQEEAGLIDLIHDSECFIGKDKVNVEVNWEHIIDAEYKSLGEVFPRKKRASD